MLNFQSEGRQMKCYVDEAGTIEAKAGDAVALLKQDDGAEWLRQGRPQHRPILASPLTPEEVSDAPKMG